MKFVRFRMLTNSKKLRRKSAIRIKTFAIERQSQVFLLRDLDLHFRFQMFKTCEIRSFSYVARSKNYFKKSAINICDRTAKYCFSSP